MPVIAGALYPVFELLPVPIIAMAVMSLISLTVVGSNALPLRMAKV